MCWKLLDGDIELSGRINGSSRIEIYASTFKFKTGNFKIIEVGISEK